MNNNTETEEATSMEADTEAIGIEAQSGLLNHVVGFHAKGAVASKSMEEETNKIVNSKSMFEKEENDENATNMENNKEKGGHVDVDKEQTVGVEKPIMKDNWEFDDEISEEEDRMDGNKGKTEESADDEEQDTMDDNKGKTEESTNEVRNITDNPETGGISLFGVGGNRNENQQKDRTNIITSPSIESKEEEQEHVIASLVTKSVLNILDDEILDDDDDDNDNDEPIVVNQDVQDKDEYTVVFQDTKLGLDLITGGGRKGVVVSKVYDEELKGVCGHQTYYLDSRVEFNHLQKQSNTKQYIFGTPYGKKNVTVALL